jgi:hypothetical protein
VFFKPNAYPTAEYISKALGNYTEEISSVGTNSTVRVYSLVLKPHGLSRGFGRGGGNFLVRSYQ